MKNYSLVKFNNIVFKVLKVLLLIVVIFLTPLASTVVLYIVLYIPMWSLGMAVWIAIIYIIYRPTDTNTLWKVTGIDHAVPQIIVAMFVVIISGILANNNVLLSKILITYWDFVIKIYVHLFNFILQFPTL